jgi:lipopolysaccharide export system permease protein
MIGILDRYILRSLLVNYVVALSVMLSLYVVLDLFVNMDEFTEHGYSSGTVLVNIVDYYWPNLFLYFSQLSGLITTFACLAAVARMRKLNEMTAMLASGVSLYRLARPVLIFGVLTTVLLVVNTEYLIPSVAHKLARGHDDVSGERAYEVLFLRDRGGKLLSAGRFDPRVRDLRRLIVMTRDDTGAIVQTLEADRAEWEPPSVTQPSGRWRLERGRMIARVQRSDGSPLGPGEDKIISYPAFYDSDLSPHVIQMRQAQEWIRFLSLARLRELAQESPRDHAAITRTRHSRVAAPIVSVILLLLALPFFLNRAPTNVLNDAGRAMMVCGMCYLANFLAQSIRSEGQSALLAWIPIFIFGTVAMVLMDRVKT